MKEGWQSLSQRERIFLLAGVLVGVGMALHMLVVEPVADRLNRNRQQVPQLLEDLRAVQAARLRILQVQMSGGRRRPAQSYSSPLVAIEKTAQQWSLDRKLKRLEPEGESEVKVWLDEAIFDDLVLWLELLENDHGIQVASLTVEQRQEPGLVDARIVFAGGGQ